MAKRGSGSRRKSMKIFRRVYAPVYHTVEAARNAAKALFRGSEKVINAGLGTAQSVGSSVAKHADETVKNVFSRRRANRRAASRRATRRGGARRKSMSTRRRRH